MSRAVQYIIGESDPGTPAYATWDNGFNDQELNYLRDIAASSREVAVVGGRSDSRVADIRRSRVSWVSYNGSNDKDAWLFDRLSYIISSLNRNYYGFDITGFAEPIQLTTYLSDDHGTYGWHQDSGGEGYNRKLSLVLQLSDPCEYEGGQLEIFSSGSSQLVPKRKGLICVFPSWTPHQVTPVVQGTRQSLVVWINGPRFR